ncbi:MAG: alkaline phosphatase family protein [Deltaproteobacteria bacterium]|nr:alkaline phosphatase family protein [Deltaproteobacteria bacterium]
MPSRFRRRRLQRRRLGRSPENVGNDRRRRAPRVAVIGLDCVPPRLVFDRWRGQLPNLGRLMSQGLWGALRSTHPPITVPAWASMVTGKDPGQLGLYGFRNRRSFAYDDLSLVHARSTSEAKVWDIASQAKRDVIILGVPQTYPPPCVNGVAVSCFLTPKGASFTHPASLQTEIEAVVPDYVFDVGEYRGGDKAVLLEQIYDKTRKHFRLAQHLLETQPWDLFMMVEMGPDRLHHGFWNYCDADDPRQQPGNRFTSAMIDYYRFLDRQVGGLLDVIGDEATVLVVSDHGARRMEGGIAINEWLRRCGLLCVHQEPMHAGPLKMEQIDWSRTRAWGDGGYCGRIFINRKGREPQGIVASEEYEALRDELIARIASLCDPQGRDLQSHAHRPQTLYAETNGIAPDLLVYFGDLAWRAIGSIGHESIYVDSNDARMDGANHDWDGILILRPGGAAGMSAELLDCDILDVAPTILHYLGLAVPQDMRGRILDGTRLAGMMTPIDPVARQHDAAESC